MILIVDDEPAIAEPLAYALAAEGLATEQCRLAREVVPRVRRGDIELVLLDIGLPDGSGLDVCKALRAFCEVPVIFLTARADIVDRVLGLELGADDYVCKPFSPREVVARVRARLRRPREAAKSEWVARGVFALDRDGHRIRYRDCVLDLTRYEHALLAALLERPGAILSRSQLMQRAWEPSSDAADRTVDTHIKTLRAKLRAAGAQDDPIRTHRGLGYSLEP